MPVRKKALNEEKRRGILHTLEHGLPPLICMPVPASVSRESWYKESGIEKVLRIIGLPMFRMDALNGKLPSAFGTLCEEEAAGKFDDEPFVLSPTSGNFGVCGGFCADAFPIKGFGAVMDSNTSQGKQAQPKIVGAEVILAPAGVNPIEYACELGKQPGNFLIHQYLHEGSIRGHRFTFAHITREMERLSGQIKGLGNTPSLFGAVAGTGSSLLAARRFLQEEYSNMKIFGVASMSDAEKVPGSRSPAGLAYLRKIGGFPYREAIDFDLVTSVPKLRAFEMSVEYIRQRIAMGPTGGLLVAGACELLRTQWEKGGAHAIGALLNDAGMLVVVLLLMDNYLPYWDDQCYVRACESLAARS
jgi:cysteine synthase